MNPIPCPGPLIWFLVPADDKHAAAALLECAVCGYVVATGNFNDESHSETPLLHEGTVTS